MKLAAFWDTTPARTASGDAWFSSPLSAAWGRGPTELLALLASGERNLLPGGHHLPILHLLDDCADLTGSCDGCKRKAEDSYSGGRKEGNVLTRYQMCTFLRRMWAVPWALGNAVLNTPTLARKREEPG